MKKLILPLFLFFVSAVSAQKVIKSEKVTDHSMHIVGDSFEGVIFTKEYNTGSLIDQKSKKFTPSIQEISLSEKLLNQNLDTVKNKWTQSVAIHGNLKKYLRQYFGYINEKGERIIYINAFWKDSNSAKDKRWLNDIVFVLDGGPAYWQIKINLDESSLFEFAVNGVA